MRVLEDCSFSAEQHAAASLPVSHTECCETPLLFGPSLEDLDPLKLLPGALVGGFLVTKPILVREAFFEGEIYDACVLIPFLQMALVMIKVHISLWDVNNLMDGLESARRKHWELFIYLQSFCRGCKQMVWSRYSTARVRCVESAVQQGWGASWAGGGHHECPLRAE